MSDIEKVIKGLEHCISEGDCRGCPYFKEILDSKIICPCREDALALLKKQQSLLGIQQTADGITFLSTGTAQQGEERGRLLGKLFMHEWLEKELLYRGLLTDDIRTVFDEAKRL